MSGLIKDGTRTVRKIMVQAAEVLQRSGKIEFTEWELTVQMWKLYPRIVGLPGFENLYPDHKRVYCELVKSERQAGLYNPYVKRVRPNCYTLCPGKKNRPLPASKEDEIYTFIRNVMKTPAFYQWTEDPSKPESLDLLSPVNFDSHKEIEDWKAEVVTAVTAENSIIPPKLASDAHDFLTVIQNRFFQPEEVRNDD